MKVMQIIDPMEAHQFDGGKPAQLKKFIKENCPGMDYSIVPTWVTKKGDFKMSKTRGATPMIFVMKGNILALIAQDGDWFVSPKEDVMFPVRKEEFSIKFKKV